MSNLKSMVPKNADGSYTIYWPLHPTTKIHCFDAEDDTGKFVAGILANPEAYIGKKVFGYTATYTPEDIVKTIEEVGGVKVSFVEVPEEAFKKALPMPPALQQEMLENFLLIRDYGYYGKDAKQEEEASLKVCFLCLRFTYGSWLMYDRYLAYRSRLWLKPSRRWVHGREEALIMPLIL
jgi:hypothetical protein